MEWLCCGFPIIAFFIWAFYSNEAAKERAQTLESAKAAYEESLRYLRERPTDPTMRAQALDFGRRYSNLTRSHSGVTVYDEVAIKNDIDAACAGTVQAAAPEQLEHPGGRMAERLQELQRLLDAGLITREEHEAARAKVLSEL
ncbi:MAG: SHOCT domain-containing protein [Fimbriimonas sp.]